MMLISRRSILMLLSPFPSVYDISMCFSDNLKLESLVIQPSNETLWFRRSDSEKETCVTLSGDVNFIEGEAI